MRRLGDREVNVTSPRAVYLCILIRCLRCLLYHIVHIRNVCCSVMWGVVVVVIPPQDLVPSILGHVLFQQCYLPPPIPLRSVAA